MNLCFTPEQTVASVSFNRCPIHRCSKLTVARAHIAAKLTRRGGLTPPLLDRGRLVFVRSQDRG
eukprot:7438465-Lingulodinium_polyedra.AAC.1